MTVSNNRLCEVLQALTYCDIKLVHLYSEGVEMTIADLCLFSCLYFLLVSYQFKKKTIKLQMFNELMQWPFQMMDWVLIH